MTMNGVDLSSYQSGLNAGAIDADFVIVKATQGLNYINPVGDQHYQQAKAAGKALGVYHFMDATDPRAQAEFFVNNISGYVGEAVLILDFELDGLLLGSNGAKTFLDRVHELTGVAPLIYMSKAVIHQMDWSAVAPQYGLWAAQYANYTPTGYLSDPWTDNSGWGAWGEPAIYQYSSAGRLAGYNGDLDLDIAYMDRDAWNKFAGKNVDNPPITESPKVVDQVLAPGDTFSFTNQIYRVDKLTLFKNVWQVLSVELAGDINADWESHGIPVEIVDEVRPGTLDMTGEDQVLHVGSWFKFHQTEPWTVIKSDGPTDAVLFDTHGYGEIWIKALSLVEI